MFTLWEGAQIHSLQYAQSREHILIQIQCFKEPAFQLSQGRSLRKIQSMYNKPQVIPRERTFILFLPKTWMHSVWIQGSSPNFSLWCINSIYQHGEEVKQECISWVLPEDRHLVCKFLDAGSKLYASWLVCTFSLCCQMIQGLQKTFQVGWDFLGKTSKGWLKRLFFPLNQRCIYLNE